MADPKVFHGALGIIKVNGIVIGKAKNVRATESFRRMDVRGIGTILPQEKPVTEWNGILSVSQIAISFKKDGLPGAIKRQFANVASQLFAGQPSFEDQVLLDSDGITMDLYKKISDYVDPATGFIRPKPEVYVTVRQLLIESESFDVSDGALGGHDQSFSYLQPITYLD